MSRIELALDSYLVGGTAGMGSLVNDDVTYGKLYEAFVLSLVVTNLAAIEGLDLRLSTGTKVVLKSAPGPINYSYPHIQISRNGVHVANIWTDVEFMAYSCAQSNTVATEPGHYHELDIVIADATASRRPRPEEMWLGIECKYRSYSKSFLREILGVRRELGLLHNPPLRSHFQEWPRKYVPAKPPVCLIAYSSDSAIGSYSFPGELFGVDFEHVPMI